MPRENAATRRSKPPASTTLAHTIERVWTRAGLEEAELLDQVRALEELKAAAAAAQARLTAHLYAVRAGREAAEGVPAAKRCAGSAAPSPTGGSACGRLPTR
ncbi:hypothetical protein [Nocardioides pocheonensis]|uniref:hypothetical protein n=1 Tax=Nocardioides pocheonensis TaxID=661485 RepID=UPI0011CDF374|nr:hypothetical protein [Nocardioides pocheonensis]